MTSKSQDPANDDPQVNTNCLIKTEKSDDTASDSAQNTEPIYSQTFQSTINRVYEPSQIPDKNACNAIGEPQEENQEYITVHSITINTDPKSDPYILFTKILNKLFDYTNQYPVSNASVNCVMAELLIALSRLKEMTKEQLIEEVRKTYTLFSLTDADKEKPAKAELFNYDGNPEDEDVLQSLSGLKNYLAWTFTEFDLNSKPDDTDLVFNASNLLICYIGIASGIPPNNFLAWFEQLYLFTISQFSQFSQLPDTID